MSRVKSDFRKHDQKDGSSFDSKSALYRLFEPLGKVGGPRLDIRTKNGLTNQC